MRVKANESVREWKGGRLRPASDTTTTSRESRIMNRAHSFLNPQLPRELTQRVRVVYLYIIYFVFSPH
jgi:hypothetical protein